MQISNILYCIASTCACEQPQHGYRGGGLLNGFRHEKREGSPDTRFHLLVILLTPELVSREPPFLISMGIHLLRISISCIAR